MWRWLFFLNKIFPVESLVTTLGPLAPRWSSLLQNYPPQPWASGPVVGGVEPFMLDTRVRLTEGFAYSRKNRSNHTYIHHSSLPPKTHDKEHPTKSLYTNILPTKSSSGTSQPFNFPICPSSLDHLLPSLGALKLLKSTIQHWKGHSACPFPSDVANLRSNSRLPADFYRSWWHDVLENCHFLPTFVP